MVKISVVIPYYNEEDAIVDTLERVNKVISSITKDYEIIPVNDGSKDRSLELVKREASRNSKIRVVSYYPNRRMGYACRKGFEVAKGEIIAVVDADLGYGENELIKLIRYLEEHPEVDIVTVSPYMRGGKTENVPAFRLLLSKTANFVIGRGMGADVHTVTAVVRAYRREVIDAIYLDSNGPEINVEILSKASALGYKVAEIPAVLRGRKTGQSKFRFRSGVIHHFNILVNEKPSVFFGSFGIVVFLLGLGYLFYMLSLFFRGRIGSTEPVITNVVLLLIIVGIQVFFFTFLANQVLQLKRESLKIQREQKLLRKRLEKK